MKTVVYLSYYIVAMFGLVTLLTASVTVVPEAEATRNFMLFGFGCSTVIAGAVSSFLSSLPVDHWVHRSIFMRVALFMLAVIVTALVAVSI